MNLSTFRLLSKTLLFCLGMQHAISFAALPLRIADFEVFADQANGTVMFREPTFSSDSYGVDPNGPNIAQVTAVQNLPGNAAQGHGIGNKVMGVHWKFSDEATLDHRYLHLRAFPPLPFYHSNPVISIEDRFSFDIYTTEPLEVVLVLRELESAGWFGSRGAFTGDLKWIGGADKVGNAITSGTSIPANQWVTLEFDIPQLAESAVARTGSGPLTSSSGRAALEGLGFIGEAGKTYQVYLDNFTVYHTKSTQAVESFSVMSYNLWGAPTENSVDWGLDSAQIQAIGRQMAYLQPDIIGFQEIPNDAFAEMRDFIAYWLPGYHIADNSTASARVRNIFVSRFPIIRSQSWLAGAPLSEFGHSATFVRDLFEAEIRVPGMLEPIHVFNVHLQAGSTVTESNRRRAEARAIRDWFKNEFLPTSRHYVFMGDLNEDVERQRANDRAAVLEIANTDTGLELYLPVNPFTNDNRTWSIHGAGLSRIFDYVLPSASLAPHVISSQVFRSDQLSPVPAPLLLGSDSATGSDHLPVMVTFANTGTAPVISGLNGYYEFAGVVSAHSLPFFVSSPVINDNDLVITATSSNPSVITNTGIQIEGDGSTRQLILNPAPSASGSSNIRISVNDGEYQTEASFTLRINSPEILYHLDFENFAGTNPLNGEILFREPSISTDNYGFDFSGPDIAQIKSIHQLPESIATHPGVGEKLMHVQWAFAPQGAVTLDHRYLRLRTVPSADVLADPTISFEHPLRFDIYSDEPLQVVLLLRETNTSADYGENGGRGGSVKWIGGSGQVGNAVTTGIEVPANQWTTLEFDIPELADSAIARTGSGPLSSLTGKGVLEAIGFIGNPGTTYNVYLDNFIIPASDDGFFLGYPVDPSGWVDSHSFAGMLYVRHRPWVYSLKAGKWIYLETENSNPADPGVWSYLLKQ